MLYSVLHVDICRLPMPIHVLNIIFIRSLGKLNFFIANFWFTYHFHSKRKSFWIVPIHTYSVHTLKTMPIKLPTYLKSFIVFPSVFMAMKMKEKKREIVITVVNFGDDIHERDNELLFMWIFNCLKIILT